MPRAATLARGRSFISEGFPMNRFSSRRSVSTVVFAGAIALLLSGCGRPVGSVTGKVTYQGKPLKGGNVSFNSTDGNQSFSTPIKEDGSFEVPRLVGGTYKVCVETESLNPPSPFVGPRDAKVGKGGPPPGAKVPEGYTASGPAGAKAAEIRKKYVRIPEKYGSS